MQLEHGDVLVMYTDGVTEATDSDGMMFGSERLDSILRSQESGVRSQEIVEAVKAGVADFVKDAEQSDDITMLVVKRL